MPLHQTLTFHNDTLHGCLYTRLWLSPTTHCTGDFTSDFDIPKRHTARIKPDRNPDLADINDLVFFTRISLDFHIQHKSTALIKKTRNWSTGSNCLRSYFWWFYTALYVKKYIELRDRKIAICQLSLDTELSFLLNLRWEVERSTNNSSHVKGRRFGLVDG